MKRISKRVLSVMVAIMLVLPALGTVYADNNRSTVNSVDESELVFNEYDTYTAIRECTEEQLEVAGFDEEEFNRIRSDEIENELLRRAKMSEEELSNLFYSPEQIRILKEYNGGRLEDHPELKRALASVKLDVQKGSLGSFKCDIRIYWEWSNMPVLAGSGIQDIIAVRWKASNDAGGVINVAINMDYSTYDAWYYKSDGTFDGNGVKKLTVSNVFGSAYGKFPMGNSSGPIGQEGWAQRGVVYLYFEATGYDPDPIGEIGLTVSYGHTTTSLNPSVSFPAGDMTISFSSGMETMATRVARILVKKQEIIQN